MNRHFLKHLIMSLRGRKLALIAAACVLVAGGATGGTLAWIYTQSETVQNTFTQAGIGVQVTETETNDGDANPATNVYQMTPGAEIVKDPVVRLTAGSESAWLFVKLDESENFRTFLAYSIADGWAALEGYTGVYWRETEKTDAEQVFRVLKDDAVRVKPEVTEAMLNTLTEETRPTLSVTAYAIQREGIGTPLEAYALLQEQGENL